MGEFISCSYPGLATHEALKQAVVDDIDRFGMQTSVAITQEAVLSHLFDIIGFHTARLRFPVVQRYRLHGRHP
jgi:hypothetical protein